jgi:hypothetical protein
MRIALIVAALVAAAPILPAYAEVDTHTTGAFLKTYGNGEELLPRLYIAGVGDGISAYNAQRQAEGGAVFYCPPENVGIVEAQYVLIIRTFVAKYPKVSDQPVPMVLLYALKEAFPCK